MITLDDKTKARILKYITVGGLGGATVGGGVGLLNLLSDLSEKAKEQESSKDDDILYVELPPGIENPEKFIRLQNNKKAQVSEDSDDAQYAEGDVSSLEAALALLLGLGAAGVTYKGTRSFLQYRKKKEKQKELDRAQRAYFAELHKKNNPDEYKVASLTKESDGPLGTTAWLAALAAVLASGVGTYTLLDKHYPAVETDEPKNLKPKKIVYTIPKEKNKDNGEGDKIDPDDDSQPSRSETDKIACMVSDAKIKEFLLRDILNNEKQASESQLADLVNAIALGKSEELKYTPIHEMFEKSSEYKESADETKKDLAVSYLCNDGYYGEVLAPLLISETLESKPIIVKSAEHLDEDSQRIGLMFLNGMVEDCRVETMCKIAGKEIPTQIGDLHKQAAIVEQFEEQDYADFYDELIKTDNLYNYVKNYDV